jgi:hypothetical protein
MTAWPRHALRLISLSAATLLVAASPTLVACGEPDATPGAADGGGVPNESTTDPQGVTTSDGESGRTDAAPDETDTPGSDVTYGTPPGRAGPSVERSDHWHAAYGVNLCGVWQPAVPEYESSAGLHSHGDGLIHIHPFDHRASFENATLGHFFDPPSDEAIAGVAGSALRVELAPGRITITGDGLVWLGTDGDRPVETTTFPVAGDGPMSFPALSAQDPAPPEGAVVTDSATLADGDPCASLGGRPGRLRWAVATYDPSRQGYQQGPVEQAGDPGTYVLRDSDVITLAFLPDEIPLGVPPHAAARLQANFVVPTDGGVPGLVETAPSATTVGSTVPETPAAVQTVPSTTPVETTAQTAG